MQSSKTRHDKTRHRTKIVGIEPPLSSATSRPIFQKSLLLRPSHPLHSSNFPNLSKYHSAGLPPYTFMILPCRIQTPRLVVEDLPREERWRRGRGGGMKGPDMQGAAGVGGRGVQLGEKEVLEGGGQRACGARRKSSRGRVSNQKKKCI